MEKKGIVNHNGRNYSYEIDDDRYLWIVINNMRHNVGQVRPLNSRDNVEEIVHEMLNAMGY